MEGRIASRSYLLDDQSIHRGILYIGWSQQLDGHEGSPSDTPTQADNANEAGRGREAAAGNKRQDRDAERERDREREREGEVTEVNGLQETPSF